MSARQYAAGLLLRRVEVNLSQNVAQRAAAGAAGRYGGDLTPSPQGMRNLTPAESRINETWSWDPDLVTYLCPAFPEGIQS